MKRRDAPRVCPFVGSLMRGWKGRNEKHPESLNPCAKQRELARKEFVVTASWWERGEGPRAKDLRVRT